MRNFLVALMLVTTSFIAFGCAGMSTTTVQVPAVPATPDLDYSLSDVINENAVFTPPVPMNMKFVENSGKASQTQDNVTVRISSITDKLDDANYTTTIEAPDGNEYEYSVFPMMIVMEIENNTDHIIRLEKTIIYLEDENQIEYPLISSFNENKNLLAKQISNAFDDYQNQLQLISSDDVNKNSEEKAAIYKTKVYDSNYLQDYERFKTEMNQANKIGFGTAVLASSLDAEPTAQVRTSDMEEGKVLTTSGFNYKLEYYSPDGVYSNGVNEITGKAQALTNAINSYVYPKISEIATLKNKAVTDIMNMPNVSDIITDGEYSPISILPGRTKKIVAPISKRFEDEKIDSVTVNVFDLPTKVDAAGNPTKRANFQFDFNTERI